MTDTVLRKRIEILVDQPLVSRILEALEQAGVKNYTLLPTLAGAGAGGAWSDDQLTGASAKVLLVTVMSENRAAAAVDRLTPLLDAYGLIVTVADVQVVRGAKF